MIRVGGGTGDTATTAAGGGVLGLNGTNGDLAIGFATLYDNQTTMRTSSDIRTKLFPGHQIRLRGKVHTIKSWDTEAHKVTIKAGYMTWTVTIAPEVIVQIQVLPF